MSQSKKILREAATKVSVVDYLDCREYLGAVYEYAKANLSSYSYLKFAEDMGFGVTNGLRLVIIGKRPLTYKAALKIATALDLHGDERRYFTTLVDYDHERDSTARDKLFAALLNYKGRATPAQLDDKQIRYFSEWYNPVLREMTMLESFQADPEWIRERLRFPLHMGEIKGALEVLESLGFVERDKRSGRYRRSKEKLHTAPEVDGLAMVRYHQKMIEIARESITRVKESEREVSALTVAIPASAVPDIKAKISALMDAVEALESGDPGAEIYQLNVQLFPFTKG